MDDEDKQRALLLPTTRRRRRKKVWIEKAFSGPRRKSCCVESQVRNEEQCKVVVRVVSCYGWWSAWWMHRSFQKKETSMWFKQAHRVTRREIQCLNITLATFAWQAAVVLRDLLDYSSICVEERKRDICLYFHCCGTRKEEEEGERRGESLRIADAVRRKSCSKFKYLIYFAGRTGWLKYLDVGNNAKRLCAGLPSLVLCD